MWTYLATPGGILALSVVAFFRGWIIPRWTLNFIKSILEDSVKEQQAIAADWKAAAQAREETNAELAAQIRETHPALLEMGREVKQILAAMAAVAGTKRE